MENQNEELIEEEKNEEEATTIDHLTAHLRRTNRGRVVDLPRWAQ